MRNKILGLIATFVLISDERNKDEVNSRNR